MLLFWLVKAGFKKRQIVSLSFSSMQLFSHERIVEAKLRVMSTEKCIAFCTRLDPEVRT